MDCFGQGGAFGASRAERRGRGAGRPAVAPSCAFASSWVTSLACGSLRARARRARACGARPGLLWPRRSVWSFEGGAPRSERGATCGRPVLCVRVKLDDFAQRRCAPLRCAPEPEGLGLAARDLDCFGQGGAFGASRAERRGRGAGRPAVAPSCAFASGWMTSLSVAARRFAARPSPKGSGLRRATWIALAKAQRLELRGRSAAVRGLQLCVRVKLDDFAQRRCAPLRCAPEPKGSGLRRATWIALAKAERLELRGRERRGQGASAVRSRQAG